MSGRARRVLMAPGLTLLLAALAACVADGRPASCAEPQVTIELALGDDRMDPADPAVCRGQRVILVIEPAETGVFHIHGYDDTLPATPVVAGERTRAAFVADSTGQFHVEFHAEDDPRGATVGVFTVHDS
ncbi:MAG TPA: hypothetical protein VHQ42_05800 [Candidatus Limnocylindria bacterium]|nr:hypothetical protein [Candidatus Limnocylindria bacterium]